MAKSANRETSGSVPQPKYKKAIKIVAEAEDLARTGALLLGDGDAYIYFMWGQPVHAVFREEDGTLLEGDRALSQIAAALASAAKISWKSNEVIQQHSLRCSSQEIIDTLKRMGDAQSTPSQDVKSDSASTAPSLSDVWTGEERRSAAKLRYTFENFPVIPTGPPLWADVPTNVIHLDVLLGSMPLVLVTYDAPGVKGVGIVLNHELSDALLVEQATMMVGKEAWDALMTREDGTVSAYEIEEDLAQAIPTLWRCRVIYRDLDTRWVNAEDMLRKYGLGMGDRGVVVHAKGASGVALFQGGSIAGVYTSTSTVPARSLAPLLPLFGPGAEGTVMLIVRDDEEEVESVRHEPPEEAPYDGGPAALQSEAAQGKVESAAPGPPAGEPEVAPSPPMHEEIAPDTVDAASPEAVTPEPVSEPAIPDLEPPSEPQAPPDGDITSTPGVGDAQGGASRLVWTPFQPGRSSAGSEEFLPPAEESQQEEPPSGTTSMQQTTPEPPAPQTGDEPQSRWSWAYDSETANGDSSQGESPSQATPPDEPVGGNASLPPVPTQESAGWGTNDQLGPPPESGPAAGGTGLNDVSMYPWGTPPAPENPPSLPSMGADAAPYQWNVEPQEPSAPAGDGNLESASPDPSQQAQGSAVPPAQPPDDVPSMQADQVIEPAPPSWDWQQQVPPAADSQQPAAGDVTEQPSVAGPPDMGNASQPPPTSWDAGSQQAPPAETPPVASGSDQGQQGGGFSVFDFSSVFSPMSSPQNAGGSPMTPMSGFQQEPEAGGGVSFDAILGDLVEIAKRTLGDKADATIAVLTAAEHSPPGIRQAIRTIRQTPIAGVTAEEVTGMAAAMSNYVADRLSAL